MTEPAAVGPEYLALQKALVGRYSLERELGRGGMGIVFLARDVALDRLVAIKLLPPAMAAQASLRERFLREAQMAAKLSHPNIIPIFAVEQSGDLVYFVMAYVEGDTLGQRVRERGPLNVREGTKLLQEVAWALAYAHLRGIVHRDVKPDNILLEAGTGRALVMDFGIARASETSGGTQIGEVLGTAQYMSPEQACGEPVDGRSDLYSLGVVGFFALSGRLPFDAPDIPALLAQHITKPAPPLASVAAGVPRTLAAVVDRCLAKDPAERFATGEELAESLSQGAEQQRELPVPIRLWLTRGEGARPFLNGWTVLLGLGGAASVIGHVIQGEAVDLQFIPWLIGPWVLFALYRIFHTHRAVVAGYTYDDLRRALLQQVERRKEELAFEFDREPSVLAKGVRWLSFGGLAMFGAGALYISLAALPDPELAGWLMGLGSAIALGGGIIGRIFPGKRLKAKDTVLSYRAKLADSKFGRWMFRIASLGAKPTALPAGATHRPTEVAIGLAAAALFETLPKDTRRELKDLPMVIGKLEADAQAGRAHVEELNTMLAGLGADTRAVKSASIGATGAGGVITDAQSKAREELTAKRDAAARRLAASVAALENLRLDLLRLKAGVGTVDELSADLAAARDLQAEIDLAIQARREVEAALQHRDAP